jgi:hypothetical protein
MGLLHRAFDHLGVTLPTRHFRKLVAFFDPDDSGFLKVATFAKKVGATPVSVKDESLQEEEESDVKKQKRKTKSDPIEENVFSRLQVLFGKRPDLVDTLLVAAAEANSKKKFVFSF